MKKVMMTLGLIFMIGLSANAQQKRGGERPSTEERVTRSTERMAEHLELSDAQKEQILAMNLEFARSQEAEREARQKEAEARKEAMKAQEEKIKSVLTEEQIEKWEESKERRRDRDRRRGRGDRGDRGDDRLRMHDDN